MKLVVILHNIRSVHNVGSIFRTADAANVEKIYLCGITPSPFDRLKNLRSDFAKVALGAQEFIPWELIPSTIEVVERLKNEGYEVLALEQADNSTPYYNVNITRDSNIAIVLGAEVEGVSEDILKSCSGVIEIPMRGLLAHDDGHPKRTNIGKESLNVSVAFGVVVFDMQSKILKILEK